MTRRILLKTFKIGNWYVNYYKHQFVEIWAIVDNKTNKIIRYGIVYHTPNAETSIGYKTLEKATKFIKQNKK